MTGTETRYTSFSKIDFAENMRSVLAHLSRYIDDPALSNVFWERFKQRLAKADADAVPVADKLLLLHSHIYFMVELFEEHDDEEALSALGKLEEECF